MNKHQSLFQGVVVAAAIDPDGPPVGVIFLGGPGSGKSSLAHSLIETCPWRRSALVADDAFLISIQQEKLIARAPEAISGLIEVRGYGLVVTKNVSEVSLAAGFDLDEDSLRISEPSRFPPGIGDGTSIPIWPFRQSAQSPWRIRPILRSILAGQKR